MKYLMSVVVGAGLVSLVGCGEEGIGGPGADPVEAQEGAASTAIFPSGKVLVNNNNTNCRVISGDVIRSGGWTPRTPVAVIACSLANHVEGQPWDTTRLRQITYNHDPALTDKIGCSIQWHYLDGTFANLTPWLYSYPNSTSHHVSFAEYYSDGNGWVRSSTPLAYTWELVCRIPYGEYLYSYTYSYEDTI